VSSALNVLRATAEDNPFAGCHENNSLPGVPARAKRPWVACRQAG
jgi:hypothetical protein